MNFKYILLALLTTSSNISISQNEIDLGSTIITEREVAVDLDVPWEILWGDDDYIWATERRGNVLRINPITGNTKIVLDIRNKVYAELESGLLGMALYPDFTNLPRVYLIYTRGERVSHSLNLVSFDWNGEKLINETELLKIDNYGLNHYGSRILISEDQKLFITVGDNGIEKFAQDLNELTGKVLRINLDGSIPIDNPLPNSYIYSFGHRNPQGLAFGPNGNLFSSEHGDRHSDEINVITPGGNYGWPYVEGVCNTADEILFCQANEVIAPIKMWDTCIAVNDLIFYNHVAIPEWEGKFLMATLGGLDVPRPRISILQVSLDGATAEEEYMHFTNYGRIRDVCINPKNGAIYFATNGVDYPGYGPNRIIEYRNLSFDLTSTINLKENDQFVKVYPNVISTNASLNLEVSNHFIGTSLRIYSYAGQLIKEVAIRTKEFSVNNLSLTKGSYFIQARNKFGTISKTFVVQ